MRKRLMLIAVLLIITLILAIKTSGGYRPFARLTEDQISGVIISNAGLKTELTDGEEINALVSMLNEMRLGGRSAAKSDPFAVINLLTYDGEEFEIALYEDRAALDGDCYKADGKYCAELFRLILDLI